MGALAIGVLAVGLALLGRRVARPDVRVGAEGDALARVRAEARREWRALGRDAVRVLLTAARYGVAYPTLQRDLQRCVAAARALDRGSVRDLARFTLAVRQLRRRIRAQAPAVSA